MSVIENSNCMENHEIYCRTHRVPLQYYHFHYPKDIQNFLSHWHDEIELTYIEKGEGKYSIETEEYHIKEGDIVIIRPNVIHAGSVNEKKTLVTQVYIFDIDVLCHSSYSDSVNDFLMPIKLGNVEMPFILRPDDRGYIEIKECLYNMKTSVEQKEIAYVVELKANMMRFFALLYKYGHVQVNDKTIGYNKNEKRIKEVIRYIENNYQNVITVDELAEISGFSTCYFMNIFKKYTGVSCVTFINQFRLDMSARKLVDTSESILSIALSSGFNNISFFNRAFKKYFGKTPREYRLEPVAKQRKEEASQNVG